MNTRETEKQLKIVTRGALASGIKSFITRFIHNRFEEHSPPTIGASFFTKKVKTTTMDEIAVHLWAMSGRDAHFTEPSPIYYREAAGILFFIDLSQSQAIEKFFTLYDTTQQRIRTFDNKPLSCIVLAKSDLQWKVEENEIQTKLLDLLPKDHDGKSTMCIRVSSKTDKYQALVEKVTTFAERCEKHMPTQEKKNIPRKVERTERITENPIGCQML
mmetsp:Transcript_1654/g.2315  ORF Transcript_1654/g.2315 Transcript_1654/m.2315 type:complete len:216 (+) Transcript_1654:140-787(+)